MHVSSRSPLRIPALLCLSATLSACGSKAETASGGPAPTAAATPAAPGTGQAVSDPTVSISSPAAGATLSGTVLVSGTASGDVTLSKVDVQVDGGVFVAAIGQGSWSYALDTTALSEGAHTLTARATDTSGNTMTAAIDFTVRNLLVTPDLWSVDLASHPIGFTPTEGSPMSGFIDSTWDRYNGGRVSVSYAADGVTRAFRAYLAAGSGTQRAEQVPVYRPGGQGTTFWIGVDFSLPVFTASEEAWGPCIFQLKRDGTGNGTALINIHGGRVVLEGASGIVSQGSSIDLGPVPSPGVKTRVVLGFLLHRSLGWVEAWRDGIQKGRVALWVSKDTSSDGPGSFGSTLPTETNLGVYLKLGLYRGGGATPVEILFSDMRAATTQAGVR